MNTSAIITTLRSNSAELPGQDIAWLQQSRNDAMSALSANGFPHKKQEDWKYTDTQPLLEHTFELSHHSCIGLINDDINHLFLRSDENCRIVFVNGHYVSQLSTLKHDESLFTINSLAKIITEQPALLEPHLAHYALATEHGFNALNTAAFNDGLFLRIYENVHITEPIHVLYLTTATEGLMVLPRNLILLDQHACATVVEHYASIGNADILVDSVSETRLAAGAKLEHIKLQQESNRTSHIASHAVIQQRDSQFNSTVISIRGKLVRSDIHTQLTEPGGECVLNGLYLADDIQHMDFHTFIEHAAPNCCSRQDYRGVLDDKSHAVFNGRIYVHKDAQLSDAQQSNKTLLLSSKTHIDSKPQLEIFADNVKCSHGATVGQLDENMLFYLRSRGLDQQTARNFLVLGFVNEVIQQIQHVSVRTCIEHWVNQNINLDDATRGILQ
ncbi:MAG: Fe-S cluster assembly protein SufD [Gammaproteobacteria bacterium]|nr:Fe-S cluster assembly protein SufD [Gammaproteobacteria bacterium]